MDSNVADKIGQFNAGIDKKSQKKKMLPIAIAVVAVVAIIVVVLVTGGVGTKNFKTLYPDSGSLVYCTIASDGSYMKIDTNPYDKDSDDLTLSNYSEYVWPANDMIEQVNKDLGFSDALMEKMNTTTWSQGRQTDSNGKYKVTWTYHPDKGLEVLYELESK